MTRNRKDVAGTSHDSPRREFLRLAARYGYGAALIATLGLPLASYPARAAAAEAAADQEKAKRARAKHVLTLGLDSSIDHTPDGAVTRAAMWLFGNLEFKSSVEQHSKGAVYVDIHDGAALGSQTAALRKVQLGVIQGADCSTQNAAELAPIWNVIDIPYSIGPVANYWKLLFSHEFDQAVRAKSAQANMMCLFTMPTPRWLEMSHKVDHEVRKPDDVKGLKIRVTGSKLEQAAFKILPANPTPIAWSEVFTAMKDGAVDGIHVAPTSVLDGGMGPVVGQLVDTDWMYNSDSTWLGTRWFKALPPELQEAVMEGAYDAQVHIYKNFDRLRRDQAGIAPDSPKVGWKTFDTRFVRLTDAQRQAWRDYLSIERNKDLLNELIDRFGRNEYELVVRVAHGGGGEPRRWWKA
ncbi:MAG TPA: TRAP transporter substrate-binding protein [Usitatibacter sp.]|jgi:TRAP-type C4-dicarboxylate transport system substrate-binding protein|nr:TRAP transporter substrate-binding protein [Usitatibacter sp.]